MNGNLSFFGVRSMLKSIINLMAALVLLFLLVVGIAFAVYRGHFPTAGKAEARQGSVSDTSVGKSAESGSNSIP